ncbi:MAG: DUF3592 domain-containing protein, partial [Gammaproteobacteria bacterium]|nr:DUF3592 domain-containing protein [Gammaproteobacteria bacterium]
MRNNYGKKKGNKFPWGILIFTGIFGAVGVFMLGVAGLSVYQMAQMQSWKPVQAAILSTDLSSHRSDDSTTYEVKASYSYEYEGVAYTGARVGISGSADNIGDWHKQWHRRLAHAQNQQIPVTVWVNPDDPAESIIDRELRWGLLGFSMLFVVVFGGVGVGGFWFAFRKRTPQVNGVAEWQSKPDWRANRIRSDAKAGVWVLWGFAIVWNLISSPLLFVFRDELEQGNHAIWIGLLFPIVGVGLLLYAIKKTLEWRRFGVTLLRLRPFPGEIGGMVAGYIDVRLPYDPHLKAECALSCTRHYWTRSGGKHKNRQDIVWQDRQPARVESGANGTRLSFEFRTESGTPATSMESGDHHTWTLSIAAELPGADLARNFEIPVYDTQAEFGPDSAGAEESDISTSGDDRLVASWFAAPPAPAPTGVTSAPVRPDIDIPNDVVQITERGDDLELFFPPFRNRGVAAAVFIMGLVFTIVGLAMFLYRGTWGVPIIFPIVFFPIGVLLLLCAIYIFGNSLRVNVSRSGIATMRRIVGMSFANQIGAGDVVAMSKSITMQSSSGNEHRVWYSVKIEKREGGSITVADGLPSSSSAEQVIMSISEALGT